MFTQPYKKRMLPLSKCRLLWFCYKLKFSNFDQLYGKIRSNMYNNELVSYISDNIHVFDIADVDVFFYKLGQKLT